MPSPRYAHALVALVASAGLAAACGTTLHDDLATAPAGSEAAVDGADTGTGSTPGATGSGGPGPGAGAGGSGSSIPGTGGSSGGGTGGSPADGGAGSGSGAAPGGGAGSDAGAGGGGPAGPAVTDPITLGFLTTEASNAGSLGIDLGQSFSGREALEAMVRALNADGGIAGRPITPVFARTDTASVSWEADYAAACATLTQDRHVDAVLGYSFAFFDSFESCLTEAGVVHVTTGYTVADEAGMAHYPLLYGLAALTHDRYWRTVLGGAVSSGYLTPANTVGILRASCPYDRRAWERTGSAVAAELGVVIGTVEELNCISGASGAGSVVTQIQSAVLRFRSRGVDTVMVEGPATIIFATAAESQGWRPRYLLSSLSGGSAMVGNVPDAQLVNFHGFGWLPSVDVRAPQQPPPNAAQERCLEVLASQGLRPSSSGDYGTAYGTCDAFFLYEAALRATNGNSDPGAIAAAIDALGDDYQSAYTLDGRTRFGGRHDAPALARPWAWDGGCGCFTYVGDAYELP